MVSIVFRLLLIGERFVMGIWEGRVSVQKYKLISKYLSAPNIS